MPLAPLATAADVEARLGRALTDAEGDRIDGLLRDVSAVVRGRSVTGQDFTRSSTVVRRRVLEGRVTLPQRPVNAVTAVTLISGTTVGYRWNGETTVYVYLTNNTQADFDVPWRPGYDVVDVTYDHGYDEIPDDVTGVVANVVARAVGSVPDNSGIVEEALDGIYSYKRDSGVMGPFALQDDEIKALRPYSAGSRSRTVRMV